MVKIKEYYEGIDELVHAILSELKKRGYWVKQRILLLSYGCCLH